MTPNRLGAENGAFTLNGRRKFLYDGELHYFRVRPELVGFSDIGGVLVSGAEAGRPSRGLG